MLRTCHHVPLRFRHAFKLWLHSNSHAPSLLLTSRRAAASSAAVQARQQRQVDDEQHADLYSQLSAQPPDSTTTSQHSESPPPSAAIELTNATSPSTRKSKGGRSKGSTASGTGTTSATRIARAQKAAELTAKEAQALQQWVDDLKADSQHSLPIPPLSPVAAYAATHNRPFTRLHTANVPAAEHQSSLAEWIRTHNSLWRDLTDDRLYSLATYAALAPFQQRKALKRLVYYVADQLQQQERRRYLSEVSARAAEGATEQEQQLMRDTYHHQFMYIIDARKQVLQRLQQCTEPMQLVRYYCECVYEWLQRYVPRSLLQEVLQPPDQPMPAHYRAEVATGAADHANVSDAPADSPTYFNKYVELTSVLTRQYRATVEQLLHCYDRTKQYDTYYDFLEQNAQARELLAPHILSGIQLQLMSAADLRQHIERLHRALTAHTRQRHLLATITMYDTIQQQPDTTDRQRVVRVRNLRRIHSHALESLGKAEALRQQEIQQHLDQHGDSAAALRQFYRYIVSDRVRNWLAYWAPLQLVREWVARIRNDHAVGPGAALGLQNEPDTPVNLLVQWPMQGTGVHSDSKQTNTAYDYATGKALFEHYSETVYQPRVDALRAILRNTDMHAHAFRRKVIQIMGNAEFSNNLVQRSFLVDRKEAEEREEQRLEEQLYKDAHSTNRRKSWSMDYVALQQWFSRFVLKHATAPKQLKVNDLLNLCHVPRGMTAYPYRIDNNRHVVVVYAISHQQLQALTQTMRRLAKTMQLKGSVQYTGDNAFDYNKISQLLRPDASDSTSTASASPTCGKAPNAQPPAATASTHTGSTSHDYYTLPPLDLMSPMPGAVSEYVNPSLADSVYDEDEDWCFVQVADNIEFHLFDSHDSDIAATQYTNDTDYMGGVECSVAEVKEAEVTELTMIVP